MDRQVKIHVQRWEPMGDGRVKVKIAEKNFHISDMTHEGVPYVTVKQYGRGRYIVKPHPQYKKPIATASDTPTRPDTEAPKMSVDEKIEKLGTFLPENSSPAPEPPPDPDRVPMGTSPFPLPVIKVVEEPQPPERTPMVPAEAQP